jgi:hypothetical protein
MHSPEILWPHAPDPDRYFECFLDELAAALRARRFGFPGVTAPPAASDFLAASIALGGTEMTSKPWMASNIVV